MRRERPTLGEEFDRLTYAQKIGRYDLFKQTGITKLPFSEYVESLYRPHKVREERAMNIDEHTATVMEAKAFVKEGLLKGTVCPCCEQRVKTTKIELTSKQAVVMAALYQYFPVDTVLDIGEFVGGFNDSMLKGALLKGKEWGKLAYWGFLEVVPATKELTAEYKNMYSHVKRKPSLYRVTSMVGSFINGTPVVKSLFILNKKMQSWDGQVTFAELFENEKERYAGITAVATGNIPVENS